MASRAIESGASSPFHNHSRTPPIPEIGSDIPRGAAWNSEIASSKFDFPEPFGPIRTFNGLIGKSIPAGPKDKRPENFSL